MLFSEHESLNTDSRIIAFGIDSRVKIREVWRRFVRFGEGLKIKSGGAMLLGLEQFRYDSLMVWSQIDKKK